MERERVGGVDAKRLLKVCIYYVAILWSDFCAS